MALSEPPPPSRRAALRLGGAAMAGLVLTGRGEQALAAATSTPMLLGQGNTATGTVTSLSGAFHVQEDATSVVALGAQYRGTIVGTDSSVTGTGTRAGVVGLGGIITSAPDVGDTNGVIGVMGLDRGVGAGVYAVSEGTLPGASPALRARSASGPHLVLEPTADGMPANGTWPTGALLADRSGNLWWCRIGGSPGTWVNLAGESTPRSLGGGLSFTPLEPGRLYDSRVMAPGGRLRRADHRHLALRDRVAEGSATVLAADYVPARATALAVNVAIVDTVGSGFLTVNPAGVEVVGAATINWFGDGQILNNGLMVTLGGDREVTVIAGGTADAQTHVVIDVTGWYG